MFQVKGFFMKDTIMQQTKFSLPAPLAEFLCNYKLYGFESKSSMVREALLRLKEELELKQSAGLYAEIDEKDAELQELAALRNSVIKYDAPTDPVGLEDWKALK
jgi:hypothetical protein